MHNDITQTLPSDGSPALARVFASLYDPLLWLGERGGMRAQRSALLSHARGRTVEIGAGTGLNLSHYPAGLDELVLTEPDVAMRARLVRRLARDARPARVADALAHQLPVADRSVDTVVCTLVLCTVDAPDLVLREILRVLRPDGRLLFIEHVLAESPMLARWQDRLERPWRRFAAGCRCNRATAELMRTVGLELEPLDTTSWPGMPPIVRPLIVGRAVSRVP